MKNIITAIDDSEINKLLKKQENLKVICKDISYKEGILEQIEKNKKIDLAIINEKIDGEISLNELIKKIKEKIRNIEIIIITEKSDEIKNEICRFKNIKIYETKKIKIKKIMKLINTEKEYKNSNNLEIKQKNVITITGASGVGKSVISIILSKLNEDSNNLLIEFNNQENQDVSTLLKIRSKNIIKKIDNNLSLISTNKINIIKKILSEEKFENIIIDVGNKIRKEEKQFILTNSKIITIIEPNLIGVKKGDILIKQYIKDLKINEENIKVLINKKNKNSIYKELIKKIFNEINIIGEIKYNNKYEKLLNNKFNNLKLILNQKERKELIKIFNEK